MPVIFSDNRHKYFLVFKSIFPEDFLKALFATVDQIGNLALGFFHNVGGIPVAHIFKVNQIKCFLIFWFELVEGFVELTVSLIFKQMGFCQGFALDLEGKFLDSDMKTMLPSCSGSKVPGSFVEIGAKAAFP